MNTRALARLLAPLALSLAGLFLMRPLGVAAQPADGVGEAAADAAPDCPPSASGAGLPAFERADVRAIAERVVCYCGCPHLQVSKCFCGTADSIRQDIAAQLDGGATADQVVARYVAEHGNWVLAVPPRQGFNWVIWLAPPALLLGGGLAAVALARRWTRPALDAAGEAGGSSDAASTGGVADFPANLDPEAAARQEHLRKRLEQELGQRLGRP